MKRILAVAGMGLAAAAVLLGTSRVTRTAQERPVRLPSVPRPKRAQPTRRHCVRLGWKAPYWYAGAGAIAPHSMQGTQTISGESLRTQQPLQ